MNLGFRDWGLGYRDSVSGFGLRGFPSGYGFQIRESPPTSSTAITSATPVINRTVLGVFLSKVAEGLMSRGRLGITVAYGSTLCQMSSINNTPTQP